MNLIRWGKRGDRLQTRTPTSGGRGRTVGAARVAAPLRVVVAGGGPVGLSLAIFVKTLLGRRIHVCVYDPRWIEVGDRITWRDAEDGNNRRRQVVTLQSNVWRAFPKQVQDDLFQPGNYAEVWPFSSDSPKAKGRPRNMRIRWIEDRLLDLAQDAYGIQLIPKAYVVPESWDEVNVVAICDGAQSRTRQALTKRFGTPSDELYRLDGEPFVETVLGLEVKSDLRDEATVPITMSQNRALFNPLDGSGIINMRLTPQEAMEIVGVTRSELVDCVQSQPCVMERGEHGFTCRTHGAVFKPSIDPHSFLWPRIQDCLRLFGVAPENLLRVTRFRLGMSHHQSFTAELSQNTYGFLLGDAACALHFWPGRGLNTGLKSALSLARCLRYMMDSPNFQGCRSADFGRHEALMHHLQYREKSRALSTMLMSQDGQPRDIAKRIRAGLTPPFDRDALMREMLSRMIAMKTWLSRRMGPMPDDEYYRRRLLGLSADKLSVLKMSGEWIIGEVGGPEVDVDFYFPPVDPCGDGEK